MPSLRSLRAAGDTGPEDQRARRGRGGLPWDTPSGAAAFRPHLDLVRGLPGIGLGRDRGESAEFRQPGRGIGTARADQCLEDPFGGQPPAGRRVGQGG